METARKILMMLICVNLIVAIPMNWPVLCKVTTMANAVILLICVGITVFKRH